MTNKKTPQAFMNKYNGIAIDDDGYANVQCVDGFRIWNKYINAPVYPTYTGWADGYWYYRESTYKKYYDFILNPKELKFGDWCFWSLGSSCKYSHVAMFVEYTNAQKTRAKFFGQNQGNFGEFRTVEIKCDILGAFRAKCFTIDAKTANSFISTCYQNILNRKADSNGLKWWSEAVSQGMKPSIVLDGFFNSKEYKNKKKTDEQFVRDCYLGYLNRKADSSGFKYWLNRMKKGTTRDTIRKGFADSNEFKKRCERLGF